MTTLIDDIAKAGQNWSIEVTPPGAGKIESFAEVLAEGTTVNVTFLPGTDPKDTVDVAVRLREDGMNPVPHIAARSLQSKDQLDGLLADMVNRARVEEVLVIGGGVDHPVGDFASSMDVLETGLIQKHGIRKIGVSGHPEGSPDINTDELAHALEWKNNFAKTEGLDLYIETQFCFEADAVVAWEKSIRAAGNTLPIRIGIPGPATIKTLFRFAQISGIGPSMRVIAKQAKNVTKLLTVQSPHLLLTGLAEAMAADPESRIAHFHYYPFGGFARTSRWASAVASGNIELLPKGGFAVPEEA
ncbi:MAG: methylenetetrahydrofolate reductase [Alphaproteobacteria bacterium]|nr:methylenetetrahydrofolate reductase [Alphaproteobacteria bacterium]